MKKKTSLSFFNSKKAFTAITTYSLILIVILTVVVFTYNFAEKSKEDYQNKIDEIEVLNSVLSFRLALLDLVTYNNSKLEYLNKFDRPGIEISLENKLILGRQFSKTKLAQVNVSSLGIPFCENYNFSPIVVNVFEFNGSCVSLLD